MQTSHSTIVAELESRLLEQDVKYKGKIAERDSEISKLEQSAEERLINVQKLAFSEQETLRTNIWFV